MGNELFDALSRAAGRATSRRQALALLLGGAAAAALPSVFPRRAGAQTSERSIHPAVTAAPVCQPSNAIAPMSADEMFEYISDCGVRCPDDVWELGAAGCTSISYQPDPPVLGPIKWTDEPGNVYASRPVTVNWRVHHNTFTSLHVIPWNACCQAECDAELERWMFDIYVHEQAHVDRNWEVIARANVEWTDNVITGWGKDRPAAANALRLRIPRQIEAAWNSIEQTLRSDPEPYTPPSPDETPCVRSGECGICVDGRCRMCEGQCCPPAVYFDKCCPTGMYCCGVGCCFNSEQCCAHLPGGEDICCPPGYTCVDVGLPDPWCQRQFTSARDDELPELVPGRVGSHRPAHT